MQKSAAKLPPCFRRFSVCIVLHRGSEACFEDIAEITPATSMAASFSPSNLASKVVTLGKLEGAAAVLPQTSPTCSSSNPQRGEVAGGLQNT
jgi:hypothetical protein